MRSRQCLQLLLYSAVLASTGAGASGAACTATRRPAERVICDHAIPNYGLDNAVVQPQALLRGEKLAARLAHWRQSPNDCTDIRCIDASLGKRKTKTKAVESKTAAVPAAGMASPLESAPARPISSAGALLFDGGSLSASAASPTSSASLVRQGNEAAATLPPAAANNALPQTVTSSANRVDESGRTSGLTGVLAALVVIAIILSVFIIRRNKALGITTNYRRARGKKRR
ncbi:hypothetical protein BZM26_30360 [Paraburkholderia strydomiana]|nr:hypothetical protein BZM26_30360 [Paraburkholderia strydomiana]